MTLSNELYSNYMDYYSNLTQDYCFKTPKIANYPLRKNQKYLPIKSQQNFASQIVNSEGTKDSIFLDFLKDADQNNKKKTVRCDNAADRFYASGFQKTQTAENLK